MHEIEVAQEGGVASCYWSGWWQDVAMLVSPLPGANRENLLLSVRDLHSKVSNLRSSVGSTDVWLQRYLSWVNEAARVLRGQLRPADIDRLVLTRRYELLVSVGVKLGVGVNVTAINGLLDIEVEERTAEFGEMQSDLESQIAHWQRQIHRQMGETVLVGLDTSVYVTHPDKLENLDPAELIGRVGRDVHVLVPMLVVEELDGLKLRGDKQTKWRASYTLSFLDGKLRNPTNPATLRSSNFFAAEESGETLRGDLTVELLFDPPGRVRLPVNDDEIIDRLLAAESLAGRPVTLVTYDTNQSFKARAAGLKVVRLRMPVESEPEPEPRQRAGAQ